MRFEKIPSPEIKWQTRKFPIIVIAENIHSPSNQGLILRVCESFGVQQVNFSGPFSNTNSNKFNRTSRSAEKFLDIHAGDDVTSLLQSLVIQHYKIIGIEICKESKTISSYSFNPSEKYAIVIGAERHGLSSATLALLDDCLYINQFGHTGSINVSMALSIALYEITKQLS